MPRFLRFLFMTVLISPQGFNAQAQPLALTTSIKPLQLLVASISAGISQPQLLIPAASSPHDYQLRPSERRQLEQADLIFWVGPELEMSLTKVLQQLPASTRVIALAAESENQDHQPRPSAHNHDHDHDHQSADLHIWLDPDRAADLAQQIATVLSESDPSHQADYQKNLVRFLDQLNRHEQQLRTLLEPVKQRGYFVFHDAYQGFEQHFQLNHLGAFTLTPDRRPGARHLAEIRTQLLDRQAVCVFSEPQSPPSLISNLIQDTQVRQGLLDPLGVGLEVNADGYFRLLTQLGEAFKRCLSDS
ncbi:MAG: zinc ABC transporter substrate-binding protein ZnuA [Motiliproteus sp.]